MAGTRRSTAIVWVREPVVLIAQGAWELTSTTRFGARETPDVILLGLRWVPTSTCGGSHFAVVP